MPSHKLLDSIKKDGLDSRYGGVAGATEENFGSTDEIVKSGDEEGQSILEDLKQHPDAAAIPPDSPMESWMPLIEKGILAVTFSDAVSKAREAALGELLGLVAEMSEKDLVKLSSVSDKGKQYHDMTMKFKNDLLTI